MQPAAARYAVQVGTFADYERARRTQRTLRVEMARVYIALVDGPPTRYYRVRVGPFADRPGAARRRASPASASRPRRERWPLKPESSPSPPAARRLAPALEAIAALLVTLPLAIGLRVPTLWFLVPFAMITVTGRPYEDYGLTLRNPGRCASTW